MLIYRLCLQLAGVRQSSYKKGRFFCAGIFSLFSETILSLKLPRVNKCLSASTCLWQVLFWYRKLLHFLKNLFFWNINNVKREQWVPFERVFEIDNDEPSCFFYNFFAFCGVQMRCLCKSFANWKHMHWDFKSTLFL